MQMTTTIYVKLMDEGTDVWRPIDAKQVSDVLFRLVGTNDESEIWEFPSGSIVRVETRTLPFGTEVVAVEAVSAEPKFTWGDSVVITDSGEAGSVCASTERDNGIFYTVELSDGSDRLLVEESLSPLLDKDT